MNNEWDSGNMKGYRIYIDDHDDMFGNKPTLLYTFYNNLYNLSDIQYKPKFGSAGELEFKMPYESARKLMPRLTTTPSSYDDNHDYNDVPEYGDSLIPLSSKVLLYFGDEIIYIGRVIKTRMDINGQYVINTEGILNYLVDVMLEPFDTKMNLKDFILFVIEQYNSKVETWRMIDSRCININLVDVSKKTQQEVIRRKSSEFKSAADILKSFVTNEYGGYFVMTYKFLPDMYKYVIGIDYVNYYEYTYDEHPQAIRFTNNMLDLNKSIDSSKFISELYPVGAQVEVQQLRAYDEETDDTSGEVTEIPVIYKLHDRIEYEWCWDNFEKHTFELVDKSIAYPNKSYQNYPGYALREMYFKRYHWTSSDVETHIEPDKKDHRLPTAEQCVRWYYLDHFSIEEAAAQGFTGGFSDGAVFFDILGPAELMDEDTAAEFEGKKETGEIKEFTGKEYLSQHNIVWADGYYKKYRTTSEGVVVYTWESAVIYYSYKGTLFRPADYWMNQFVGTRWRDLGRTEELDGVYTKYSIEHLPEFVFAGRWVSGKSYTANSPNSIADTVVYSTEEGKGKTYLCIRSGKSYKQPDMDPDMWKVLFDFESPISKWGRTPDYVFSGPWNQNASYASETDTTSANVVIDDGITYACIKAVKSSVHPANDPEHWRIIYSDAHAMSSYETTWSSLKDEKMSEHYGAICSTKEWSSIEDPNDLLVEAARYLTEQSSLPPTIEVNAFDLSFTEGCPPIKIGHIHPVMSRIHGLVDYMWGIGDAEVMSASYLVKSATIDVLNPANSKYVLGTSEEGLAERLGKYYAM